MKEYEMKIFRTPCFMCLCKNGNTLSIFKHIYTLKTINKYTARCFVQTIMWEKRKLSYRSPHLRNKFIALNNKNTLTGPANCKETTKHHAHLSLCAKSRKTNDAKSRKWQKSQFGQFFDDFEVKYLLEVVTKNIFKKWLKKTFHLLIY